MKIEKLNKGDVLHFRDLIEIFRHVFDTNETIPEEEHLSRLLSNPDFMVFVVKINGKVVGGLTIYVLHRYLSLRPIAYIYDVGIAPEYQGKGMGNALLAGACAYCKQHNFEEAYVEAESDDIDAVNFYRKSKHSNEMKATHFTYSFHND